MHANLVILNASILSHEGLTSGDIAIADGKVVGIGSGFTGEDELDATGLTVMPGAIDTQVHFREPGFEHKEDIQSGTQSAVLGGVTTVFEMPNTSPATVTRAALEDKLARAKGRSWCNIAFFVGATLEHVEDLADLEMLAGTPGIKIFMGSSTGDLLVPDDHTLRKVLRSGKRRVAVHAEDHYRLEELKSSTADPTVYDHPKLRDELAAFLATSRIIELSRETGRPVHVLHVSTADELPLLAAAKKEGLSTTCEATPQHLIFAAPEIYDRIGTLAQMNPPIRASSHRDALRKALQDGLFDVIGSDHAPHTLAEKAKPYPTSPSGMPGVQTLLPAMLTLALSENLLSLQRVVQLTSHNPAQIYGIRNKGLLQIGYDADLAIVDLNKEFKVEKSWIGSKCGWSPFEEMTLTGFPVHTIVNGRFAMRDGVLSDKASGATPQFDWK